MFNFNERNFLFNSSDILSLQNVFGIICEHVCFVHYEPLIAKNVTLDFFHHLKNQFIHQSLKKL